MTCAFRLRYRWEAGLMCWSRLPLFLESDQKNALRFTAYALHDVRFHGVEGIGRVGEAPWHKFRLYLLQKTVALGFTLECNDYALLIIRIGRWSGTKFAHA